MRNRNRGNYIHAITFALKRLWDKRKLALSLVLGLWIAVVLTTAIPIYSDGINANVLQNSLNEGAGRHQAFDFVFRYIGSWNGAVSKEQYAPVNEYLSQQASPQIGLPLLQQTRYLATSYLQLYPEDKKMVSANRLERVKLAFVTDIFDHIYLIEGNLPSTAEENDEQIEVLVALDLANALDLNPGETYILYVPSSGDTPAYQQSVTISGLWIPDDPESDFWSFYSTTSFEKKLLASEESWWAATEDLSAPIDEAAWRITLDGRSVTSERVPGLLARIIQTQNYTASLLPNTALETSPVPSLREYRSKVQALTGSLFAFSMPVLGLVLFFLSLAAGLFIHEQKNEIAVLRSRGAPRMWILVVYLVEWGLLGLVAWLPGLPGGLLLAGLMGRTQSFLDFSNATSFTPRLGFQSAWMGLLAVLVGIAACLIPVWREGQNTVLSYKQERARTRKKPLWQRFYLDFACLLPALYGSYTLSAQGRLNLMGRAVGSADPFQNPLLFLLPSLFLLGSGLLALRLLPWLLNLLARLSVRLPGTTLLYVLRQYARSGRSYQGVLLLAICTVGLAAFIASEASSLDRTTHDSIYTSVGADLNLSEGGEYLTKKGENDQETGLWNFLPIENHLTLPGVAAATRVGYYSARLSSSGYNTSGQIMGIDRADFAQVAFFRDDFANESLIGLLNRLAARPDAVLVDQQTWEDFGLNTGDTLPLKIEIGEETYEFPLTVVGVFNRFPTWSPEDGEALFVINLDTIFEAVGAIQPYNVWLATLPDADTSEIVASINEMGVAVITVQDAKSQWQQAVLEPGRQGVLGMLSVGFLSAAGLAVTLILLYILFSFRERAIQMGVLRAIGMTVRQMRLAMAGELALLIVCSLLIGVGIGVLAVQLYVPYLPVQSGAGVDSLPHVSQIAWSAIGNIALWFIAALGAGIALIFNAQRRMNLYQAIKLGETI